MAHQASLSLNHRDLGGAGKPPLVILHGLLGSSRNWQTAGADLAAAHHVFALDLRNHGRSPHSDETSHEAMAADVEGWLDAREIGAAALLGHSMGGKVAMLLACRRPERVESLIAVDVVPRRYSWPERREEFAAMNELELGALANRAEAGRRLEGRVPDWGTRQFLLTNLDREPGGAWRWTVNLAALGRALPVLEENPLGPGDRFGGPALFVAGSRSSYVRPDDGPLIRGFFPAARIEWMATGHNPHQEAREAFVRVVLDFTASTRGASKQAGSPPGRPRDRD